MGTSAAENEILIPPPWIELPGDVTANILQRLGAEEILKSSEKVCTTWNQVCRRYPSMWRVVHLRANRRGEECEYDLMCRCAVDRSQGQLIDLKISCFGDDDLLNYVARRSSHLRRLKLVNARGISAFALTEAVKKFPLLEELHLVAASLNLSAEDVETIGRSCPLLRSFMNSKSAWDRFCRRSFMNSESGIALAIAKTMPNLRSLKLDGDMIDNEGLEAILDGCPGLESLHIYNCEALDQKAGDLGERCRKQIKDLRLPYEQSGDGFVDYILGLVNDHDLLVAVFYCMGSN